MRDQIDGNVIAGRMRLQWFRDQITAYYDKQAVGASPYLRCLFQMIHDYGWSYTFLDRIIEARVRIACVSFDSRRWI